MAEKKEKPVSGQKKANTKGELISLLGKLTLADASVEQLQKAHELRVSLIGVVKPRKPRTKKETTPAASSSPKAEDI